MKMYLYWIQGTDLTFWFVANESGRLNLWLVTQVDHKVLKRKISSKAHSFSQYFLIDWSHFLSLATQCFLSSVDYKVLRINKSWMGHHFLKTLWSISVQIKRFAFLFFSLQTKIKSFSLSFSPISCLERKWKKKIVDCTWHLPTTCTLNTLPFLIPPLSPELSELFHSKPMQTDHMTMTK